MSETRQGRSCGQRGREEAGGGAEGGAGQDSPFSRVCRLARTRRKVCEKPRQMGKKKKKKRERQENVRRRQESCPPSPAPDPFPSLPRPKQPVNKPTSSLPPAPLLRRPLRALGIAAGATLTGLRGRRAVPPQPRPPALWVPRPPGRRGRRCGRILPGCPAAAAPQLPAAAAAMLA
jgi:hypothetical protein